MLRISKGPGKEGTQDGSGSPNRDLQGEKTGCAGFETFPFIPLTFINPSSNKSFSRGKVTDQPCLVHPIFLVTMKTLSS